MGQLNELIDDTLLGGALARKVGTCSSVSLNYQKTTVKTTGKNGDSDCVGGVLARSCPGADHRQPGIPRRATVHCRVSKTTLHWEQGLADLPAKRPPL